MGACRWQPFWGRKLTFLKSWQFFNWAKTGKFTKSGSLAQISFFTSKEKLSENNNIPKKGSWEPIQFQQQFLHVCISDAFERLSVVQIQLALKFYFCIICNAI